jgi:hypothetical protein
MTTSVMYSDGTNNGKGMPGFISRVPTSAEATANSAALDFSALGMAKVDGLPLVQVIDASGNENHSGLDVSVSGTTVTVAVTSLAATDTITCFAVGNKNF